MSATSSPTRPRWGDTVQGRSGGSSTEPRTGWHPAGTKRPAPLATVHRYPLGHADAELLQTACTQVQALAVRMEETLTVAAYRAGTLPSAWVEARVDAIRDAATELAEAVRNAPITAD